MFPSFGALCNIEHNLAMQAVSYTHLWEIRIQYDYRASDDVKGLYKAGTPMRAYEEYPSETLLLPRRINRVYRYYNDTMCALAAKIEKLWPADKTA